MKTVLFIKANDRPIEKSVSLRLYDAFLRSYRASHPEDQIVELDLYRERLPYLDNAMIGGMYKSNRGLEMLPEEKAAAEIANRYADSFIAADKAVFAFPLWNFTIPAVLHTYMDYLFQPGKTVKYTAKGPVGLLEGKKVALLNARGGVYSEGAALEAEMAVKFMTMNMRMFGVRDLTTIIVEGHNQYPERAAMLIDEGLERAAQAAKSF